MELEPLNLHKLQTFIERGKVDISQPIDMRVLLEAGAIGKPVDGVKLLGEVCKCSSSQHASVVLHLLASPRVGWHCERAQAWARLACTLYMTDKSHLFSSEQGAKNFKHPITIEVSRASK